MPIVSSNLEKSIWITRLRKVVNNITNNVSKLIEKGIAYEYLKIGASGDKTLRIDYNAEKEIIDFCKSLPIPVTLISEERGILEIEPTTNKSNNINEKHLWVIADPIDGSRNAKREIPFFNTSIAIANGPNIENINAGIVFNLISKDEYFAEKGIGSFKNLKKVYPSKIDSLKKSIMGVDLLNTDFEEDSKLLDICKNVMKIRNMGAVAEEICFVGAGSTDLYIYLNNKLRVLDIAAAKLFVEEAGAIITDETGKPHIGEVNLLTKMKMIVTANKSLFNEVSKFIS
ncbi:MAG: inositol monophosphatase family protein [Candidatus Ranarchaeia archaeon]